MMEVDVGHAMHINLILSFQIACCIVGQSENFGSENCVHLLRACSDWCP